MPSRNASSGSIVHTPSSQSALDQVRDELSAMADEDIQRDLRVNPRMAIALVEAAAGRILPLREELIAIFGARAAPVLERLPFYARACAQALVEERASAPRRKLTELHDALRADYDIVIAELDALLARKVLDPSLIAPARATQGYEATIRSTRIAVFVARQQWSTIEGKTQLTRAILDSAADNADRLERAMFDRNGNVSRAPASEIRVRALSKMLTEYDELRRMVRYLRWHQRDADRLAPSPFATRGRARREKDPTDGEPTDPEVTEPPVTPSPRDGAPLTS